MNLVFLPSYSLSLEYSHPLRTNPLKHYLNNDYGPGVCWGHGAPAVMGLVCKQLVCKISGHPSAMREACPQHPTDTGKKEHAEESATHQPKVKYISLWLEWREKFKKCTQSFYTHVLCSRYAWRSKLTLWGIQRHVTNHPSPQEA